MRRYLFYRSADIIGGRGSRFRLCYSLAFTTLLLYMSNAVLAADLSAGFIDNLISLEMIKADIVVTGVVTDESGAALPGATVQVKGTQIGAITDLDGSFKVMVSDETAILVVSFIGMETLEVKVGKRSVISISLVAAATTIDEVVVTGYQKVDRRLFTGAASRVSMGEIGLAGETDISKSLEGQVSGVSVQNVSSTFGTAPKIRIRGASSIYGVQKPLWVVDGIVLEDAIELSMDDLMSGDMNTLISSGVAGLNMDDIADFQILKDGSATAIYGARASNGVVVITTKSGKKGRVNVNYSDNVTIKPRPTYSQFNIMNSVDQMSVSSELYEKGWINIANTQDAANQGVFGKMFGLVAEDKINWASSNDELEAFLRKYETANTDWFKELFRTGVQQQRTISISGGGEKSTFYSSIGYLKDNGWTIADNVSRYTALLKGTFKLSDKFSVTTQGTLSFRDQTLASATNSDAYDGGDNIGGVDRYTGRITRPFDNNPFIYALTTSRTLRAYDEYGNREYFRRNYVDYNILDELEKNRVGVNVKDMAFNSNFEYKLRTNLTVNARVSARYFNAETTRKVHENSNEARALRAGTGAKESELIREQNKFLYERPGSATGIRYSPLLEGGILEVENNKMENYFANANVNWNPKYGDNHIFTVLAGTEIRYINRSTNWFDGYGHFFDMGNVSKPSQNYLEYLSLSGSSYFGTANQYERFLASFANVGYSFKGKYVVNGTFRYEGSNRMGKSKAARWMPAWNLSAKWAVYEEDFLKDISWLSQLNLRAGYSLTALPPQQASAALLAKSKATSRPFDPSTSELAINIESVENKDLTWEKTFEFNAGADIGLFMNRLTADGDFYMRRGFDLIGSYTSNGISGARNKMGNAVDMNSYGFEFSLAGIPIKTPDFKWHASFNFSYNKNVIQNLKTDSRIAEGTSLRGIPVQGGPIRAIFSSRFAGLDNTGMPTFFNRDNERVKYLEVQSEDFSDFVYSGSIDPTTQAGLSNTFTYKGVSLSVLVSGQFGHKKRVMQDYSYKYNDATALNGNLVNRWRVAGDENITNIPAILDADQLNSPESEDFKRAYILYGMSDLWIADASFVRLKNVSLSYQLPTKWLKVVKFTNASVSAQATNLALLWLADREKLNGEDPEFVWSGGTSMPIIKQFTFSVKLGF